MPMKTIPTGRFGLNEVRPRRPEQSEKSSRKNVIEGLVSMKSGLEGRNNAVIADMSSES